MTTKVSLPLVVVCVKLPRLLVMYYNPLALKEIVNMIGLVLRMYAQIAVEVKGKYARFCIQLDLDKPLPQKLKLGKVK